MTKDFKIKASIVLFVVNIENLKTLKHDAFSNRL